MPPAVLALVGVGLCVVKELLCHIIIDVCYAHLSRWRLLLLPRRPRDVLYLHSPRVLHSTRQRHGWEDGWLGHIPSGIG
jgi:hypothetical protein